MAMRWLGPWGSTVTWADGDWAGLLTLGVSFWQAEVLVVVRGELDSFTAPQLATVLAGVTDGGYPSVVVDLADCGFMDRAGLAAIAAVSRRMAASGRSLRVRSPSFGVRRLVELVGSAGLTFVEDLVVARSFDPELGRSLDAGRVAAATAFLTSAITPPGPLPAAAVDRNAVDASLGLVVSLARALVGGADGASVSLRRDDHLSTVAASDDTVLAMDANQYATGQGPCVDASTLGLHFHTHSLDRETRWPAFTPRARALGIEAIVSSPLLVGGRPVGALNIYSRTGNAFTDQDQDLASLFAAEASAVLGGAEPQPGSADRTSWFAQALATRQVIALAQGILMERGQVDQTVAFRLLRRHSGATSQPLRQRAEDIVASVGRPTGAASPDPVGEPPT